MCKIISVKKHKPLPIDDEFAKKLGAKDLNDLKSLISKQINDEYKNSLLLLNKYSKEDGIDRVMNKYNLDAIISPTGSPAWSSDLLNGDNYHIGSSSPAARAGYPNITIPMGNVHGLPVGISFFGRAWSESKLIEIAFDFEQVSRARIIPNFKLNDQYL